MKAVDTHLLVPFDGSFRIGDAESAPPKKKRDKNDNRDKLDKQIKKLRKLQKKLYADDRYAVLLVFQAMDAAGKDGTIRAVMTGINPAGCQVFQFKAPSDEELDHDFLWRIGRALPERGRIGIFNRSHYEEVLVVRVHPEYLDGQKLPPIDDLSQLWDQRYESIRNFEQHAARNGTVVIKFFLNVSKEEQKKRFLDRIDESESNWKFSAADITERARWADYMEAYEICLNETSRPWAPWYVIPADDKPYMRRKVAGIIVDTLEQLDISFPKVGDERRRELESIGEKLRHDG